MSLAFVVGTAACSTELQVCSRDPAAAVAIVDTGALALANPERVVVCLDDLCSALGLGGGHDESDTHLEVFGDEARRSIAVRTVDGKVLAGPSIVDIPIIEQGCPGEALQGRFIVTDRGEILPEE